ncbi:MAG: Gp138 family membrane-puncturing spike protein [Baekduiaceae bacterium]
MSSNPTEHEILLDAIRGQLAQVNTALPGTVVSYDSSDQTASVRLGVKFRRRDPDTGEIVAYSPPIISGAPVAFPGAGAYSITWDLTAGDSVLVVFASRSLDEWASVIAEQHEPQDVRRFDLTDAVVVPALRSPAAPIPAAGLAAGAMVLRAPEVRLGSSAASGYVALATAVGIELQALWTAIQAHVHPGVTVGAGSTGTTVYPGSPGSVAATKVKAE